jgi:hypothetical protein
MQVSAMNFLNNVHHVIGDNMKFLQQLKNNPDLLSSGTGHASTTNSSSAQDNSQMQALSPMLMMLLMQLLMRLNGGNGLGSALSGNPLDNANYNNPFLGNGYYPSSALPAGVTPPQNNDQWIQTNPAYQYLQNLLSTSTASSSTDSASTVPTPNFADHDSLNTSLSALLSGFPDPNNQLQNVGSVLDSLDPASDDVQTLKGEVTDYLTGQGVSNQDLTRFSILYDALNNNRLLTTAQAAATSSPSAENTQAVTDLTQLQNQIAQAWQTQTSSSSSSSASSSALPDDQVEAALAGNQFTQTQLGQSLKYMLDTTPTNNVDAVANLISGLTRSGTLNIGSFLNADYLEHLSTDRQNALLGAVQNAGLILSNGKPNSRFLGYILDNLSKPESSSTQRFLQQFLDNAWAANAGDTTTADGQTLNNLLDLAGIARTPNQPLF